jgi:beta-xylosidase
MDTLARPYRDPSLPIEARVADLLVQMTRAEKLAQLGSFWAFEIIQEPRLERDRLAALAADGLGELTRLAGSTDLLPKQAAEIANEIQRFLVEETRLGIPAIIHEESLHGLLAWEAPCFQQSIGAAASFDPSAVTAVVETIRRRMLMTGARHALGPVFDIARDPRWGRVEETYGEDPYLAAVLGCAHVIALQGDDLTKGVLATAKHMVGHGLAEGGMNQAPAHVGWRELRDEQLMPFEAAVRQAGIGSVMPAYCDVDGIPCHGSRELLTTILRDTWAFDGIVSSDYIGIEMLATAHELVPALDGAARLALEAGLDSELPRTAAFGRPLLEGLESGDVDESLVDAAVGRMLRMKFRLGLFEQPYVELPSTDGFAALAADEAMAGLELARRSLVLVRNEGLLPLRSDLSRIAVIGPIADSARDLLGDYSHVVHMETLREMRGPENALGAMMRVDGAEGIDRTAASAIPAAAQATRDDELTGRSTVLDAIRGAWPDAIVESARGCGISDGTDAELAAAIDLARASQVAILVLGERSGLTEDSTTGEFRDRLDLGLIGRQQELLEAVVATGTPVVLVVVSGRPLALSWAAEHVPAILLAWVPGDAGPRAIAETLAGATNPGGKLPITFVRHVGQVPLTYRHHPTGGRSHPKGDYVDGPTAPLWPFGYGLSYTTFAVSGLSVDSAEVPTAGGEIVARVDVQNTGAVPGDEVVQLYVRDQAASVARPVLELRGFHRVSLAPGERRTVGFRISVEQLAYTDADYRRVVEPGGIELRAGTSSADLPAVATVVLTGPTVELTDRHRYLTDTWLD